MGGWSRGPTAAGQGTPLPGGSSWRPPPSRGPPSADAGLPPALWGPAQPQPMPTQRLPSSIRDRRSSVLTGPPRRAREPPLEPLWRHLEACATSRPWATWSPWPVKQFFAYFIVIEKGQY